MVNPRLTLTLLVVALLVPAAPAAAHTPPIGTVHSWPDVTYDGDQIVLKDFKLRAVGPHIEVWVGTDLAVDTNECRSSNPANLVVTDAQTRYLVDEFEHTIRPVEAKIFGTPRPRDGSHAQPELLGLDVPADAFRGDGDHLVVLVDNFRSGGWTLPLTTTDRNILAIKAQGWPNNVGAHPRSFGPDKCRSFNGYAVPHNEEALLAHEYNHLTKENRGGDGALAGTALWITEGIAEWATVATGYIDPGEDSIANFVTACFLGRQAKAFPRNWYDPFGVQVGGPENSLTSFSDPGQGGDCEYGPPKTLMLFLSERYGAAFVRDLLFTEGRSGIADGLVPTLARYHARDTAAETLQDWSTSLVRRVNLETPLAYAAPGAPPNGADFVRLRSAAGKPLPSDALKSLQFTAPTVYPPAPVEWTVDNGALYSGSGDGPTDRVIVRPVTVDAAQPTLSFDARYDTEPDYDYGFVQVSTDGGATFHSRPATTTRPDAAPDADPGIIEQLPGFNGDSGGLVHETVDLSDLAGQNVLIAFRLMTDGFVNQPGLWIDNVAIGSTPVSDGTTLDGWKTITEIRPVTIAGISARVVAFDAHGGRTTVADVRHGALTASQLSALRSAHADTVVAIVNHYEPTEKITSGAPYALTVNGVLQPGG